MMYVKTSDGTIIGGLGKLKKWLWKNHRVQLGANFAAAELATWGVAEAPPRPRDTDTHTYTFDLQTFQWVAVERAVEDAQERRANWELQMTYVVQKEGRRRVDALIGAGDDADMALRKWTMLNAQGTLIEKKIRQGQATNDELMYSDMLELLMLDAAAVRAAEAAIIADLPNADPATFDATTHVLWPQT